MSRSTRSNELDMDAVWGELGQFGRYQVTIYLSILISILFSGIYLGQYIFATGAVQYRCKVPECEVSPPEFDTDFWGVWALPESGGRCDRLRPVGGGCGPGSFHANETLTCDSWVYERDHTIVAEFDLACEEWKRTLVGTIHSAGVFMALPITAFISDNYGRRTALIMTAVAAGVAGVARAFSNSYVLYVVLEFVEATVGAGAYSTGFILALEMVGVNRRVLGGNIISSTFALGQVVVALTAWAFPYWRTLTLIIYAPSILFILYIFVIEESVRWLISKGRKKEAAKIIFKAAAINNKKLSPETIKILNDESVVEEETKSPVKELPKKSLAVQVLRSKTIMTRLCVCCFWWITLTFVYYGLSINSVSLAGNSYVNYILTSLVEIPGYCLSVLTMDRFGRKASIMTAFIVCGLSLVGLPFVPENIIWLQTTLNMIGKLCISMAFSSIYIYTSELFPTEARHTLLGACSMIGRIGSLVAPQTPLLMTYMESLPYLIFGIMACTSGLLMLLTPETLRVKLPDTIEQAENISKKPQNGTLNGVVTST
ncbi:organic cation transporter protein isoform X1 [Bombyx mori]|uniref:Major facilitator superfamily (MFS) profile domain-containing protein n=1 Tax=Bombyx mori TaxID=7091 RepID=A0A8R2R7J9_BOMMO|nr:organic cation transporter protein isoform X1 [Bombyx mori]